MGGLGCVPGGCGAGRARACNTSTRKSLWLLQFPVVSDVSNSRGWGGKAPARLWLEIRALQAAGPVGAAASSPGARGPTPSRGSGTPPVTPWAHRGRQLRLHPGPAPGTRSLGCRDGGWFLGLPRGGWWGGVGSAGLGFIPQNSRSQPLGPVSQSRSSAEASELV